MSRPTVISAKVPVDVAHQLNAIALASGVTVSDLILESVTRTIEEHWFRYQQYRRAFEENQGLPGKQKEQEEST